MKKPLEISFCFSNFISSKMVSCFTSFHLQGLSAGSNHLEASKSWKHFLHIFKILHVDFFVALMKERPCTLYNLSPWLNFRWKQGEWVRLTKKVVPEFVEMTVTWKEGLPLSEPLNHCKILLYSLPWVNQGLGHSYQRRNSYHQFANDTLSYYIQSKPNQAMEIIV